MVCFADLKVSKRKGRFLFYVIGRCSRVEFAEVDIFFLFRNCLTRSGIRCNFVPTDRCLQSLTTKITRKSEEGENVTINNHQCSP